VAGDGRLTAVPVTMKGADVELGRVPDEPRHVLPPLIRSFEGRPAVFDRHACPSRWSGNHGSVELAGGVEEVKTPTTEKRLHDSTGKERGSHSRPARGFWSTGIRRHLEDYLGPYFVPLLSHHRARLAIPVEDHHARGGSDASLHEHESGGLSRLGAACPAHQRRRQDFQHRFRGTRTPSDIGRAGPVTRFAADTACTAAVWQSSFQHHVHVPDRQRTYPARIPREVSGLRHTHRPTGTSEPDSTSCSRSATCSTPWLFS
jgi:hypothetical protein